jgi:1-deoxy-D-xylulose-5-phosphate reductoisomerase
MNTIRAIRNVTILGATGSIGLSTLDVIARHPDRYRVFALSAATNVAEIERQCLLFKPRYAVMREPAAAAALKTALAGAGLKTEVLAGAEALADIASHTEVDVVMAAIVGAAGLPPSLAAARAGKTVLLANKEALVMSGKLFMDAIHQHRATLLPIDSEHNAIFQSLPRTFEVGLAQVGVEKIVLTASGGPFRTRPLAELANVTPEEACAHPNWVMGRKISVDSATMMNKGLEVIEAHWLFAAAPDQIEVVIHPQSVIHSMVTYKDGSVIAELGNPDMRTPIAYGLGFPERIDAGVAPLDLVKVGKLEFEPLDENRFPCVSLAYAAMRAGGTAPAMLNAANEVAVEAFLSNGLRFVDIANVVDAVLQQATVNPAATLEAIEAADAHARRLAMQFVVKAAA